jgi:hypothetical protein
MFHTSSVLTPQNRLWLILTTLLLANATTNLVLQVRWSWDVEQILDGSGSAFNLARATLFVCRSIPVRPFESNHFACRFMTINWVSDSILVSVPHFNAGT